jgi:Protein of unknown function (DUF3485)
MLLQKLAPPLAIALVLGTGTVCGLWTDRWHVAHEIELARERLPRVAMTVGDWQGEESDDQDTSRWVRAGIRGNLNRIYKNPKTGAVVSVLVVCGRPGPIVAHTPQTCLPEAGYAERSAPTKTFVPGAAPSASFWHTDFTKVRAAVPSTQRIYWSWRGGLDPTADWNASDEPRLAFLKDNTLFKLYVIRLVSKVDLIQDKDPCEDFIRQFLPELEKTLFVAP